MRIKTLSVVAGVAATVILAACGGSDHGSAPDVQGLPLPDAKQQLKASGYSAAVSTDAMFGVIVESHFTVCKESAPKGQLVPLKVNKEC